MCEDCVEKLDFCLYCELQGVPLAREQKHWNLCQLCYDKIWRGCDVAPGVIIEFQKLYFKWFKKYGELRLSKPRSKAPFLALWYSVSPPRVEPYKITDGHIFIEKINKFLKARCIVKAIIQYEWKYHDTEDEFYGIHCHMLLFGERGRLNWHIARQKDPMYNLNEKQKWFVYDKKLMMDKINYFSGETWDDNKNREKKWDKKTRVLHGLAPTPIKM